MQYYKEQHGIQSEEPVKFKVDEKPKVVQTKIEKPQ